MSGEVGARNMMEVANDISGVVSDKTVKADPAQKVKTDAATAPTQHCVKCTFCSSQPSAIVDPQANPKNGSVNFQTTPVQSKFPEILPTNQTKPIYSIHPLFPDSAYPIDPNNPFDIRNGFYNPSNPNFPAYPEFPRHGINPISPYGPMNPFQPHGPINPFQPRYPQSQRHPDYPGFPSRPLNPMFPRQS